MSSTSGAPVASRASTSQFPARALEDESFHDTLYRWIERAPWLALSLAAHFLVFLVLTAIPWRELRRPPAVKIEARLPHVEEDPFDDVRPPLEEIEPDEPDEPREPQEDPLASPDELAAVGEASDDGPVLDGPDWAEAGDPLAPLGLGGGPPAGKIGGRGERASAQGPGQRSLAEALAWLAAHQSPDGSWDADGFSARCGALGAGRCDGPGSPLHDVGVSSLALLAFLGTGTTHLTGQHRPVVARGLDWLRRQQDRDTGLVGPRASHDFLYDHALATLVLCEATVLAGNPVLARSAQRAVDYALRARTPYGGWRYDAPSLGESDTSVTGWMVMALSSAREAGLRVDPRALDDALAWLDEVSDPASGRVGYDARGALSARTPANARFPAEAGEAMTAVGLLSRFFLGQDPARVPLMERHADLLARSLPRPGPDEHGRPVADLYYWYHGTYALFQTGGARWERWERALEQALLPRQVREGDERGSWDPSDAWGHVGGRVYATALAALCLEVHFRYGRLLGTR